MEISKKKLLAITLVLTTFLAMFAVFGPIVVSTEFIDVDDYCWIEGVLHDDTYALYPYAEESMDIGFSKYGEMIGYNEDTEIGVGLQYPGYEGAADDDLAPDGTYDQTIDTSVDPFCNEYIGIDWWMNGWFIDIKYRTPAGADREIWAMALFSDGVQHGGDWIVMPSVAAISAARPLWQEHPPYANPDSDQYAGVITPLPDKGGRKTNGYCETQPIEIIYNGPRKFIALTKTTVSDVGGGTDLVDITFTFIFNKAEKNVIILKDVKRLYTKQPMNVQFGNRGEWDLGMAGDTDSYTHWYTDQPVQYWDMDEDGTLNKTEAVTSFDFFKDYMVVNKAPKKWWDDVPEADRPTSVYNEFKDAEEPGFPATWLQTQPTCYGREWHMDKTIKEHSYAVAQVISGAGDYVGALAVWPHPEFWSAANTFFPPAYTKPSQGGNNPASIPLMLAPISRMLEWHKWTVDEDPNQDLDDDLPDRDDIWVKADDIRNPDGTTIEPIIPFIIYEHDFKLTSMIPQYRIVSVYALTDWHDADDADADDPGNEETWSNGLDVIDREIQYQLDEIFDPWDIYDAMHKNTKRWVQFFEEDIEEEPWDGTTTYQIMLDAYREIESGDLIPSLPVVSYGYWDAYCTFSERVLVDTGDGYELIYPLGYQNTDPIPNEDEDSPYYTINPNTGLISFYEYTTAYVPWYLPEDSVVKVLWSSEHHATTAEQWDEMDLLYPFPLTQRFPLHHDILDKYKPYTEVFYIDDAGVVTALVGGDYVYDNSTGTIYLQDPVPACHWLWVEYDGIDNSSYIEFFHGDGKTTAFDLSILPESAGLTAVYNTTIVEHVIAEGVDDTPPVGYTEWTDCVEVPAGDSYYNASGGLGTYEAATHIVFSGVEEWEWLCTDTLLVREDWIIRESPVGDYFSTCDELVIDDDFLVQADSELKIVFKVPSGRYEWAVVGEPAASVDVAGAVMTVAAFKNKLMEFGLSGLDVEDVTFGPTVPWLIREDISPDARGRYHLHDDWCYSRTGVGLTTSWPIASSNIITVGGPVPNMVTNYLNDYVQAMAFTNVGVGFYGVTCWDKAMTDYAFYAGGAVTDRYGYAVISTYKDKNGTVLFQIYGFNGQDTYYACKWFDEHKYELQHINLHVTDLILRIEYKYSDGDPRCPPVVTIREKLGTISEKPQHDCP